MEEVAGGSRGEAAAGCRQAAGPLELCSLRSSKNYMSCFHSIVNGYASLPEDEDEPEPEPQPEPDVTPVQPE